MSKLLSSELSGKIIACAIEIHKSLGPGLLESAYKSCLAHELTLSGMNIQLEKPLPLEYKGVRPVFSVVKVWKIC